MGHVYAIPALLVAIRNEEVSTGGAVTALSRIRDKRVVDHLIDMLDDNVGVIQLIKITGVNIGYREPHDTEEQRRRIQARWRTWWNKNRERAYLRSRAHAWNPSFPLGGAFTSEEWWVPTGVRPYPPLKLPGENR